MAARRARGIWKPASLWVAYLCGAPLSSSSALWRATFKGDTGIAPGHPEFEGKLLEGYDASGAWPESFTDHNGHGTAMAGVLGANINNGVGIAGIADKVRIRPIRLTDRATGRATATMKVRSWEAALKFKDTDIIVFAYGSPFTQDNSLFYKRTLEEAVRKGIFVVTASFNSDTNDTTAVPLPCSLAHIIPGVLCVAATSALEPTQLLAEPSELASLGSPGSEVWAPRSLDEDHWVYKFKKYRGSSVATAAVGGLVALIRSFKNFKPAEIERMLLNSTEGRCRTTQGKEMLYGVLRPDLAIRQAIALAR
ncbi:hypothetical protein FOL46_009990 [Perkinsus olseni]|uniref:subtilisin n=1 Tax=Perkinsus olseni TaxID=32597 RepID=A0A7J6MJM6_PEROL|nr:hypothetical protein FOL46_009990 [Perkinsus olseni]